MTDRQAGLIVRLFPDKGFGFLQAETGGPEYFFHRSAAPAFDTFREGQWVTFAIGDGAKGPRAEEVRAD